MRDTRIWGLGFHFAFPGQILNFLRRRPCQSLLIRVSRIALWASPQAKLFFREIGFREIHGGSIARTLHPWRRFQRVPVSVLVQDEVSVRDAVADETFRLRTGIPKRMCTDNFAVQYPLIRPHLHMMLVTKRAKFLAWLGSRHRPSSGTPPKELPSETVYEWDAPVPLDFGVLPRYLVSYASTLQASRVYSLPLLQCSRVSLLLFNLRVAGCVYMLGMRQTSRQIPRATMLLSRPEGAGRSNH